MAYFCFCYTWGCKISHGPWHSERRWSKKFLSGEVLNSFKNSHMFLRIAVVNIFYNFLQDVYEIWMRLRLNPFYAPDSEIKNKQFILRVRGFGQRYFGSGWLFPLNHWWSERWRSSQFKMLQYLKFYHFKNISNLNSSLLFMKRI